MNLFKIIFFLFFVTFFNKECLNYEINTVPEINYEMIPLQRWKVSRKELINLKNKLKLFIAAEIQNQGAKLIRKYYKEFYNIEDIDSNENDNMNDNINLDKIIEQIDSEVSNFTQIEDSEDNNKNSKMNFITNGPIALV